MREPRDAHAILQDAEQAAEAGDFTAAEHHLREAARLQEEGLGPRHPDLANTLNNLGIVCERTGKPDQAEQYFRRAVSIARTSLAPDHPFVATSQKNLRDFCEARGTQVEPTEDRQLPPNKLFQRIALGALGPIAMLMVVAAAGLPRLGAPELTPPSAPVAIDPPRDAAPPPPAREDARPVVVRASLCGGLEDWSCDPADRPVPLGPLFFYTQIASTSATTVQHRWYQDDRLHRTVQLRVQPNRAGGYRTYSRNLMTDDSVGNWKIEIRSEDDVLLYEERFTVR